MGVYRYAQNLPPPAVHAYLAMAMPWTRQSLSSDCKGAAPLSKINYAAVAYNLFFIPVAAIDIWIYKDD